MIMYAVAIFDRATEYFARPAFVHRPAEAIRSFTDEVNRKPTPDAPNQLFSHPNDYELWQLGLYDDGEGAFENSKGRLVRAADVKSVE